MTSVHGWITRFIVVQLLAKGLFGTTAVMPDPVNSVLDVTTVASLHAQTGLFLKCLCHTFVITRTPILQFLLASSSIEVSSQDLARTLGLAIAPAPLLCAAWNCLTLFLCGLNFRQVTTSPGVSIWKKILLIQAGILGLNVVVAHCWGIVFAALRCRPWHHVLQCWKEMDPSWSNMQKMLKVVMFAHSAARFLIISTGANSTVSEKQNAKTLKYPVVPNKLFLVAPSVAPTEATLVGEFLELRMPWSLTRIVRIVRIVIFTMSMWTERIETLRVLHFPTMHIFALACAIDGRLFDLFHVAGTLTLPLHPACVGGPQESAAGQTKHQNGLQNLHLCLASTSSRRARQPNSFVTYCESWQMLSSGSLCSEEKSA